MLLGGKKIKKGRVGGGNEDLNWRKKGRMKCVGLSIGRKLNKKFQEERRVVLGKRRNEMRRKGGLGSEWNWEGKRGLMYD